MNPSMRLLMTADAVGGVWTYALDLATGLVDQAVETTLMIMGPSPTEDQRRRATAVPGLTLIDTGLPLDWTATAPDQILEAGAAVRALALKIGAEIVQLNSPALAVIGGFSAPVVGVCHSCLDTWWAATRRGRPPADFHWRGEALRRGLAACDRLVAPSHAFAHATARAHGGAPPRVVHNGRLPSRPGHTDKEGFVFTSGRLWDDAKNIAVLDAAAGLIRAPLYAAGPLQGPDGSPPLTLTHARPLGALAEEDVRAWLERALIYASGALYEPFGLGVLEAAQAGCALVLSDTKTFRELWEGAAVFVDPRRPAGFARALDALLADEAQAARLGARAHERAGRYTALAMSQAMAEIYRDLLQRDAPPVRRREAAA